MIKGITITLISKTLVGEDDFGCPIYEETREEVNNVLVVPVDTTDVVEQLNLTGKKAVYTLGIPKGDKHVWQDQCVEFFGKRFRVFTEQITGIEEMIPLSWGSKVMVENYE